MKKKWLAGLCFIAAMLVCMTGCGIKKQQSYTFYTGFDTITTLQLVSDQKACDRIAEAFEKELVHYHQLFDIYFNYRDVNNIKTINDQAGKEPVKVDPEIIEMLKLCEEIYQVSDGKVNVAMGSVLNLWHEARMAGMEDPEQAKLPEMDLLVVASQHTDISKLVIDEAAGTVYIEDPDMRLDVGAVAKGFAAQRLADFLKSQGVEDALLDLGGNVIALGKKIDHSNWRLATQNPDLEDEKGYCHIVKLQDKAIVTSGDYQRFYIVDGKKYHHIIDRDTLMPTTYFSAVAVIAEDSGLADGLSTALFSMDLEAGKKLADRYDDIDVLWTAPDGTEYMTDGFSDYLIE